MQKIPLIKPFLPANTADRVLKVLESGFLTEGPVTREFEKSFCDYIGCEHSLAVTSCTTGLELALRCLGVGAGDEVIIPDYTYPATAGAVQALGATAVIVDVNPDTWLIDYDEVEANITETTKVIMPVSGFGNPLNYHRLLEIKEKYSLFIIEDSACSIGSEFDNKKVGNWCDISVFSCHPRKFITTGEGGVITTNNRDWYEWMNSYKHFGMNMNASECNRAEFIRPGSNYKLSNILSAVGLEQMKMIDELLKKRRKLADNYNTLLQDVEGVSIPQTTLKGIHSYQTFLISVSHRDEIMNFMRKDGIEVQIGTYSLHMHPAFTPEFNCRLTGAYTYSLSAFKHALALPLYHEMTPAEQGKVVKNLIEAIFRFT